MISLRILSLNAFALLVASSSYAQATSNYSALIQGAVQFLESAQQKTTDGENYFAGEWPGFIYNDEPYYLLGEKGKHVYDSNCFTVASIHNILASAYLLDSSLAQIPPMLKMAALNIERYRDKGTYRYGFWQYFERKLQKGTARLRGPNHYSLHSDFILGAANVPADADDTAVALTSLKFDQELNLTAKETLPSNIGQIFSKYRDFWRRNVHYYNLSFGFHTFTGAYLTWLKKESYPTPLEVIPHRGKPYIPYGVNEVDCVVNANVLTALAAYDELDAPGARAACKFVNTTIRRKEYARCGVYYPNRFHLHYAVAKALAAGASCLEESRPLLVQDIIEQQGGDGSWKSPPLHDLGQRISDSADNRLIKWFEPEDFSSHKIGELNGVDLDDHVQSTAYALNALLRLDPSHQDVSDKGVHYLEQSAVRDETGSKIYWPGGTFFSGGTLIRNAMRWRSDSYTTALVVETLLLKRKLSP